MNGKIKFSDASQLDDLLSDAAYKEIVIVGKTFVFSAIQAG
jgi:hypothetical protein